MPDEEKNEFTVIVCGGGNAAQVATAMYAARYSTIAVSLYADEAAKWKEALGDADYELTLDTGKVLKSRPDDITNDPSVAAKADMIILAVPSFAHGQYFEAFEPYIKKGTVIACMPARSGGDLLLAAKLGAKADDVTFVGFETLPWACRFTDWGKKATILGTKGSILAAVTPPANQAQRPSPTFTSVVPHDAEQIIMPDEEKNEFTVIVCGGGNAAQVATAMYSARYSTIAVSLYADEAAKWKEALGDNDYELTLDTGKVLKSRPDDITNDPSVAAKADMIVLAVPSFAHGQYFEAFEPYIKKGTVIACMPARSGGDLLLAAKLGAKADDVTFVGFETLPWACRFTDWGKKATILGTKGSILAAVTPPANTPKAFAMLQGLLGVFPNCTYSPNNLGISLRNPGAQIHPGVMYGRWCPEKWDGNPVDEKPLFYQGVEEFSESVLMGLTNEVQAIRKKMEEMVPGLDLGDAGTLHQWYLDSYAGQMPDSSSLRMCMNTNPGYRGLTHP
eukprot:CAMPEP_0204248656 /NCGR_PEP_ID=MMETSP0361-20130328/99274_1 /ASSEMBLY_ACC=CAM_ASM_000343 /TAXON_ID=268821 /ORGANISM="Scrippsiella Hangoei, Strain SHTV-5" /LENGTH=505 /DNA_ID=CAMNT_0051221923 /DNA_START=73 /DNA_END=1587 /DNA_ORIENTATION=-